MIKNILLVDNDIDRLKEFKNEYPEFLIMIDKLQTDSSDAHFQIKDISLLLLHKNYYEDDLLVTEEILEEASKKNVKCWLFSGETSRDSEVIPVTNMYRNLTIFLNHYKGFGELIADILRFGPLYFLEDILKLRNEIFTEIFEKPTNSELTLSSILENKIEELLKLVNFNYEQIQQSIELLKQGYSVGNFRSRVDDLIFKY